jgi:hypothetical protein
VTFVISLVKLVTEVNVTLSPPTTRLAFSTGRSKQKQIDVPYALGYVNSENQHRKKPLLQLAEKQSRYKNE